MNSNNFKDILEAYSGIYSTQEVDEATAMAKRGLDEPAIRQKIAKSTGGGKAADRATELENKPTYGDSNKTKQRQDLARKQRGDFRKTTSSSPGLHGYAHKSDDPEVKAKQKARGAQRGVLTPNERKQLNMGDESFDIYDLVLEFLCVEGYAEDLEDAESIMVYLEPEAVEEIAENVNYLKSHHIEVENIRIDEITGKKFRFFRTCYAKYGFIYPITHINKGFHCV